MSEIQGTLSADQKGGSTKGTQSRGQSMVISCTKEDESRKAQHSQTQSASI